MADEIRPVPVMRTAPSRRLPEPTDLVPVPSGDSLDLLPDAAAIRSQAAKWESIDDLVAWVRTTPGLTRFRQDAFVAAWLSRWTSPVPDEVFMRLEAEDIGIHGQHPLFDLWDLADGRVRQGKRASPFDAAILWGATATSGKPLYAQAAIVFRANINEWAKQRFGPDGLRMLVDHWARASGVTNRRSLATLAKLVREHLLNARTAPKANKVMSVPLDREMFYLAQRVALNRPRLALAFFRCLQRVAALQENGEVRWFADWLYGKKTNADAIPGASTHRVELMRLLNERVWERVSGYRAGPGGHPITYRLKIEVREGRIDTQEFARRVGLTLSPSGKPARAGRPPND